MKENLDLILIHLHGAKKTFHITTMDGAAKPSAGIFKVLTIATGITQDEADRITHVVQASELS